MARIEAYDPKPLQEQLDGWMRIVNLEPINHQNIIPIKNSKGYILEEISPHKDNFRWLYDQTKRENNQLARLCGTADLKRQTPSNTLLNLDYRYAQRKYVPGYAINVPDRLTLPEVSGTIDMSEAQKTLDMLKRNLDSHVGELKNILKNYLRSIGSNRAIPSIALVLGAFGAASYLATKAVSNFTSSSQGPTA